MLVLVMVQVYVPLWQASQQEYHPLVFSLEAWETHQVTVHTMEIAASEARQLPLGAHSPEIAPFPAGFLLIDLHPLRPSDFIFSVGEIWLSGFPGTEIRPRRRREPEETTHVNPVFLRKGIGTGLIVTLALEPVTEAWPESETLWQGPQRSSCNLLVSQGAKPDTKRDVTCLELVTGLEQNLWPGLGRPELRARGHTASACSCFSLQHNQVILVLDGAGQRGRVWTLGHILAYLAGWRGALSLPTLSLSSVFFLYWGLRISLPRLSLHGWLCLTLSPSPFRCAHPLLTPPTPHPTPQCSLEEQFLFLPR